MREKGQAQIIETLEQMGAARVSSFVWLFWKFAEQFLPYYLWDLPSRILSDSLAIRKCCGLFSDDNSRRDFLGNLRLRLFGDFSRPRPLGAPPDYFSCELFELLDDECFVDCGAYNGDTIHDFLSQSGGRYRRILAFEPDPENFSSLRAFLSAEKRLSDRAAVYNAVVTKVAGKVRFSATGSANATVSAAGELQIDSVTLDRALAGERPTFIKMDIEGSEGDALEGGRQVIAGCRPVLAISIYHRPNDLWTLPVLMHELEPESHLSVRNYRLGGFDTVCFAVPPQRLRDGLNL